MHLTQLHSQFLRCVPNQHACIDVGFTTRGACRGLVGSRCGAGADADADADADVCLSNLALHD
jgi:hypothetical protein